MGKSTISMAMFNGFLYVYQRVVCHVHLPIQVWNHRPGRSLRGPTQDPLRFGHRARPILHPYSERSLALLRAAGDLGLWHSPTRRKQASAMQLLTGTEMVSLQRIVNSKLFATKKNPSGLNRRLEWHKTNDSDSPWFPPQSLPLFLGAALGSFLRAEQQGLRIISGPSSLRAYWPWGKSW